MLAEGKSAVYLADSQNAEVSFKRSKGKQCEFALTVGIGILSSAVAPVSQIDKL